MPGHASVTPYPSYALAGIIAGIKCVLAPTNSPPPQASLTPISTAPAHTAPLPRWTSPTYQKRGAPTLAGSRSPPLCPSGGPFSSGPQQATLMLPAQCRDATGVGCPLQTCFRPRTLPPPLMWAQWPHTVGRCPRPASRQSSSTA